MAKGGRSTAGQPPPPNPDTETRKRLRKLALSKDIVSDYPAKVTSSLNPSKTVVKHHGRDLLKKTNRKNRFLLSFPGLIGPVSGGKIGELKDLGSKNPVLYLDFPQGRMKLFGTIVYPKNRYLTLQFSKGGKNVMCDDYFDNMIVFSDAWWIGTKEENPEETQLSFPENMNMGQQTECDFQGGAGSTSERIQRVDESKVTDVKHSHQSPKDEAETDFSDSEINTKDLIQTTATRHSTRTSGKSFKFAESSSADDAIDLDMKSEFSDGEDKEIGASLISSGSKDDTKTKVAKVSVKSETSIPATKSKGSSNSNKSSLVQSTISTLFKKKEEKMAINTSPHPKSSTALRKKLLEPSSEEKVKQTKVGASKQKGKAVKETKTGTKSTPKKKKPKIPDDEIEEISDSSEDSSDEDWDA